MLNLIFAESALELVPKSLWSHPSVVKRAKALGKKVGWTLLDRSYHHKAMVNLRNNEKRGRPDIVHFSLLEALGTPLNKEGWLKVYVHTINDYIISIEPLVRLPRNYNRFVGLIEQLYKEHKVPIKGRPLLQLSKGSIEEILFNIKPAYTILFTRKGEIKTLEKIMKDVVSQKNTVVIIGNFPRGSFSEETIKLADRSVSIDPEMLEAWTITSRLIYEFERQIQLPQKRWEKKNKEADKQIK